jgi:hypothetical protein
MNEKHQEIVDRQVKRLLPIVQNEQMDVFNQAQIANDHVKDELDSRRAEKNQLEQSTTIGSDLLKANQEKLIEASERDLVKNIAYNELAEILREVAKEEGKNITLEQLLKSTRRRIQESTVRLLTPKKELEQMVRSLILFRVANLAVADNQDNELTRMMEEHDDLNRPKDTLLENPEDAMEIETRIIETLCEKVWKL